MMSVLATGTCAMKDSFRFLCAKVAKTSGDIIAPPDICDAAFLKGSRGSDFSRHDCSLVEPPRFLVVPHDGNIIRVTISFPP